MFLFSYIQSNTYWTNGDSISIAYVISRILILESRMILVNFRDLSDIIVLLHLQVGTIFV